MDYIKTGIPLYEAAIKGDWKTAREILDRRPELVRCTITEYGDTVLHVAASAKSTKQVEEFVEHLLTYMEHKDMEIKNNSSNTALCLAAIAGNLKMVKMMVKKNRALVAITGSQGMTPLYMAALFGNYEVVKYLYDNSDKLRDKCWTPQNRGWLILKCVETNMFDIALEIVKEHPELGSSESVLGVLARKTDVFTETESNIFKRTFHWVTRLKMQAFQKESKAKALELLRIIWKNISEKPRNEVDAILGGPPDPPFKLDDKPPFDKEDQTLELPKQISDAIDKMPVEIQSIINKPSATIQNYPNAPLNAVKKYSSRILFVAAEMGNTGFIVELIRRYPDLIWKIKDNNQSIFHIAVKHRHAGIFNLLHQTGSMKGLITPLTDRNGNNMLHLVGKCAKKKQLEKISDAAFLMQRELLWFKEIKEIIPPLYQEQKNKDGLTPHELFTMEHKELVKQGEVWMKGTANPCLVVAALISTIAFATSYSVQGGGGLYNPDNGIPLSYQKVTFMVFLVADAVSLFSSTTSLFLFLSLLTSRYAEHDFFEPLPRKLILGLATLFLSITAMMVAFIASFFVLYQKWIPNLITLLATMPLLLYAKLQFPLLKNVARSIYDSSYLFLSTKHVRRFEHT